MQRRRGAGEDNISAVVEAMVHPVRGRIIAVVNESPAVSAAQVAELIQEPVQGVRYHLRYLAQAGLIETEPGQVKRGAVELLYRPLRPPLLWDEEYSSLSESEKLKVALGVLTPLFADATRAVRARTIAEHHHLTRVPAEVDPQGWKELLQIHLAALEEVQRVKLRAGQRLAESSEDPMAVVSGLLCFEVPPLHG